MFRYNSNRRTKQVKRLIWIGSSRSDLKGFPERLRRAIGYALHLAQLNLRPERTKMLSGLGSAKVLEIRENDESGTYRVVYTVEFQSFVFVLYAFQKKSKTGIATPKQEIELIKKRLKDASQFHKNIKENKKIMKKKIEYEESSGNVFADLEVPNPEEALAKAKVARKIRNIIKKKRLTQAKAAKILKVDQPKISLLLRGYLTNFSLERLFRFLNDLGQDVHISITPSLRSRHGCTRIEESSIRSEIAALGK
ncbi:MAG: XRE family transcriptional regulator [Simkania negevensis]|nr:XRE family transcriptional regulator [Simkania negevensis]